MARIIPSMNTLLLILLLYYVLTFPSPAHLLNGAAVNNSSDLHDPASLLHLHVGFNISVGTAVANSANAGAIPISKEPLGVLHIAIPTVGEGFFFPILSSPSFRDTSQSLGFSFGFFFSYMRDNIYATVTTFHIYLAVCAGKSGNYSRTEGIAGAEVIPRAVRGVNDSDELAIWPQEVVDGFVVPMRIINLDRPLGSVMSSLVLVPTSEMDHKGSTELQLRDYDGSIMWRMSNVSMIEMQDTGNLLMYDSVARSNVVWTSFTEPSDTLLQGQMLKPGMEIRSNDSSYTARMEKGGLVLYLHTATFIEHPSPYWVLPVLYDNASLTDFTNLSNLVLSSPCSSPTDPAYAVLGNSSWDLYLRPGSCNTEFSFISANYNDGTSLNTAWSFTRVENDGRLHTYGVIYPATPGRPSIQQYALDSKGARYNFTSAGIGQSGVPSSFTPFFTWGKCDVPMACGPLGICTPDAENPCTCPPSFDLINKLDPSKGCKRQRTSALHPCHTGNEHINTTQFLQLNETTSVFLFSGWKFSSISAPVEECQKSCSLNCSCNGFFYQANLSSCFFISDGISLLSVTDDRLHGYEGLYESMPFGLLLSVMESIPKSFANDYVTYLKVASPTSSMPSAGKYNSTPSSGKKPNVIAILIAIIIPTFMACLMIGLAVHCLLRAKKRKHGKMREKLNEEEMKDILPLLLTRFSYKDLHEATGGFGKLLGAGGCGSVYAGVLPDGRKVAVKMLELLLRGQSKQFLAEVATIGRTNHVNIVRLLGFCLEMSNRLLVYEYVERGSLDHWLFSNETLTEGDVDNDFVPALAPALVPLLDWQTRYNVALEIARGLSYLHEDCAQPILHFDIKPQNILLDSGFVAKLADFGMSKLMQRDISEVVTGVRGTPGYIAPEWLSHGVVSKKTDVYSMGMVMLEIVGGRRNVDLARALNSALHLAQREVWHFPTWAAGKCQQGMMMEIVDKRLYAYGFDEKQAQTLIYASFWCIQDNPELRPYAPTVVQWLEGSSPVEQPPFSPQPAVCNALSALVSN